MEVFNVTFGKLLNLDLHFGIPLKGYCVNKPHTLYTKTFNVFYSFKQLFSNILNLKKK